MEVLALRHPEVVEAKYRALEAERAQQERVAQREASSKGERQLEDDHTELSSAERLMEEITEAARARRSIRLVCFARKKEEVIRDIVWKLYAKDELEETVVSDERISNDRQSDAVSLNELDTATQCSLRMFFRLCASIRESSCVPANTRLVVQLAHRVPSILASVPQCTLSLGFKDDRDCSALESKTPQNVFLELLELFGELLECSSAKNVARNEGLSEARCLSSVDQVIVVTAYLALSLKYGRLRYVLMALQFMLECDQMAFTTSQFKLLEPLFNELASTHAEPPSIPSDQDDSVSGFIMSFGKGDHGKLGHGQCTHASCQEGNCTENKTVPTLIEATRGIKFSKVDSLSTHSIGITINGEVMAWGNGDKYRLGHGSTAKEYVPRVIESLSSKGRVRDVSCGLGHTIALMESGEMYSWGNGSNGRLGLGDILDRSNPTIIPPSTIVTSGRTSSRRGDTSRPGVLRFRNIYCGASHSMAISYDGQVFTWGKNNQGQCGHGHTNDLLVAQEVVYFGEEIEGSVVQAAGGWEHSLFSTTSGRVYACGCGYKDSRRTGVPPVLGLGDFDRRVKPSLVLSLAEAKEDIVKVACGWDHSIAISATGQVFTWGSGTNGKLGHGDEENCELPTLVRDMDGKVVIDAKGGCEHTILLTANHEIWSFGHGDSGRLGHGDNLTKKLPGRIDQFSQSKLKPVAIAAGDKYNLILVDDCDAQPHEHHEFGDHKTVAEHNAHPLQRTDRCEAGTNHQLPISTDSKRDSNLLQDFQADWVLSLSAQLAHNDEPAQLSEMDTSFAPTSAKQTLLFVFGHIDRIASEYIKADSNVASNKRKANLSLAETGDKLMPFAIDTSMESFQVILELLQWSFSKLDDLILIDSNSKTDSSRMEDDRIAFPLSLLRILRLNLARAGTCGSTTQRIIPQLHSVLLRMADTLDVDEHSTATITIPFGNRFKALQTEAALTIQSGFHLFYSTIEAKSELLLSIVDSVRSAKVSHVRIKILAEYLLQNMIFKPVFKLLLCSEGGVLLLSLVQVLLAHCERRATDISSDHITLKLRATEWPQKLLNVMYVHVLGNLVSHLSDGVGVQARMIAENVFLSTFTAFIDLQLSIMKRLHTDYTQSKSIAILDDPFLVLALDITQSIYVVLRDIRDSEVEASRLFRLIIIDRALPSLVSTVYHADEMLWRIQQSCDIPGTHSENKKMGTQKACMWLQAMCTALGSLLGVLCCDLVNMSAVQASPLDDERVSIKRIILWTNKALAEKTEAGNVNTSATDKAIQVVDDGQPWRLLLTCGVSIANTALRRLVTGEVRCSLLREVTESLSTNLWTDMEHKEHFGGPEITQAISNYYSIAAAIAGSAGFADVELEEALRIWCVPLSRYKIADECASNVIKSSRIAPILSQILLMSHDNSGFECSTFQTTEVGTRGYMGGLLSTASLPLKLKPSLLKMLNTDVDSSKSRAISVAWEALCCIGLQLAGSMHSEQGCSGIFLCKQAPLLEFDSPQHMISSITQDGIDTLVATLFAVLSRLCDEEEKLADASYHLHSLVLPPESVDNDDYVRRWREQTKVYVLGNAMPVSASRRQPIGLAKASVPFHTGIHEAALPKASMATKSLTLAFWVFVNEFQGSSTSTLITNSHDESVNSSTIFTDEKMCLVTFGGSNFQHTDEVFSLSCLETMTSIGMIIAVKQVSFRTVALDIAASTTSGPDIVWKSETINDCIATGRWNHIVIVCTHQEPIQVFLNGALTGSLVIGLDLAENFFHEASNWSTIHVGGRMEPSTGKPTEVADELSKTRPQHRFTLTAALDDVWVSSQRISCAVIQCLASGGSALLQGNRQVVLEKQCCDVLRLLHALLASHTNVEKQQNNSTNYNCVSNDWATLLIRLRCKCFYVTQPDILVYLCDILSQILPSVPEHVQLDISDLVQVCVRRYRLERNDTDNTPLALLFKLERDSKNHSGDSSIFSKRRELLRLILHQFEPPNSQAETKTSKHFGISQVDKPGDQGGTMNEMSHVYLSSVQLVQNLARSRRWQSWFVELLRRASSGENCSGKDLDIAISILSGYPRIVPDVLPANICRNSASYSFQSWVDGVDEEITETITRFTAAHLGSKCWQNIGLFFPQHPDATRWNQYSSELAASVTHMNLRTRLIRFLMCQLQKEGQPAHCWSTFLVLNPVIAQFFFRVGSESLISFVKNALGADEALSSYHDTNARRLVEQIQDTSKWNYRPETLVQQLESLQWKVWEAANSSPLSLSMQGLLPPNHPLVQKSPLESVAGSMDLCGLQAFARESFPTVKLPTSSITASSGLWFYEAVLLTDGLMQIGFLDGDFVADPSQGQGVGDHASSWAFDGYRCKKWNVSSQDYGRRWRTNDVIGVLLDTDRMEISFFLNGQFLGVAFSAPAITASTTMFPAASLSVCQAVEFVIGPPPSALISTKSSEEVQMMYKNAFRHWPQLGSLQDQKRLKPVVAAIKTSAIQLDEDCKTDVSEFKPLIDCNEKSAHAEAGSSDETRNLYTPHAGSDLKEISDESLSTYGIIISGEESQHQLLYSAVDSKDTPNEFSEIEARARRHREIVERLSALGIPLEMALHTTVDSGVAALGTSSLDGEELLNVDTSTPSKLASTTDSNLCRSETIKSNLVNTQNGIDKIAGTIYKQNDQIIVDDELQPNLETREYFTYRQSYARDTRETLDAIALQNSTSTLKGESNIRTSIAPVCITSDSALCVLYCRQVLFSFITQKRDQTSTRYADLYEIVSKWSQDRLRFMNLLRVLIGLHPSEPTGMIPDDESGISYLSQMDITIEKLLCIEFDLATASSPHDSDDIGLVHLPVFAALFDTVQQQSQDILTQSKQQGNSARSYVLRYDAAWYSWTSKVLITFAEIATSRMKQDGAISPLLLKILLTTCFSSSFLAQIAKIALSMTNPTLSVFKYCARKRLAQICRVLKNFAHENDWKTLEAGLSVQEGGLQDVAHHIKDIIPIPSTIELLAKRWRREKESCVYASDLTSALFELIAHVPLNTQPFGCMNVQNEDQNHALLELRISNISSHHLGLSWEWKQKVPPEDEFVGSDAGDESNSGFKHPPGSLVSLHVEACTPIYEPYYSSIKPPSQVHSCPGSIKFQNLASDTMYRIRAVLAEQPYIPTFNSDEEESTCERIVKEVYVQTPPEPIFELDRLSAGKNLAVLSQNLTVKNAINKKWHSVRSTVGFEEGVHEWQVRIDVCISKNIFIGICTAQASMENYIGSDAYGYGFLANKAVWFNKTKLHTYGEIFKQGDIIKVTLDCTERTLSFSRNGEFLGIAATNIKAGGGQVGTGNEAVPHKWYPAFSLYNKDDQLTFIPPSSLNQQPSTNYLSAVTQHASMVSILRAAQYFLAYDAEVLSDGLCDRNSDNSPMHALVSDGAAFYISWLSSNVVLKEIGLGHVVLINSSPTATETFGLHKGDMVFTPDGQCTVQGVYNHLLWFEKDLSDSYDCLEKSDCGFASAVGSWNLSTCQEMLKKTEEFPIHRRQKEDKPMNIEADTISHSDFHKCQQQWNTGKEAATMDIIVMGFLEKVAEKLGAASPLELSFQEVESAWNKEKHEFETKLQSHFAECPSGKISPRRCFLSRAAFLMVLNANIYNIIRVLLARNSYERSFSALSSLSGENPADGSLPSPNNRDAQTDNAIVVLSATLESSLLSDRRTNSFCSKSLTSLLFRAQRERLITEDLKSSTTTTPVSAAPEAEQDTTGNLPSSNVVDLPIITITYPSAPPCVPFWELQHTQKLANQLTAYDSSEWRREMVRPFNVLPILQTFVVAVTNPADAKTYIGLDKQGPRMNEAHGQENGESEETSLSTDTVEPCVEYLQLLECALREVQSPQLPLFIPVYHPPDNCPCSDIKLDVNTNLLFPLADCTLGGYYHPSREDVLRWFFVFGQIMGIAWRSQVLLPLQFLSTTLWNELIDPSSTCHSAESSAEHRFQAKAYQDTIDSIRSGLLSIVPSRCLILCGSGLSLRSRLSDLNVNFVGIIRTRATFSKDSLVHAMFWKVVETFSSTERRLFAKFLVAGKPIEVSEVVLQLAEAPSDGRERPDASFPVITVMDERTRRIHLPEYSSPTTLRAKLTLTITNVQEQ